MVRSYALTRDIRAHPAAGDGGECVSGGGESAASGVAAVANLHSSGPGPAVEISVDVGSAGDGKSDFAVQFARLDGDAHGISPVSLSASCVPMR